jgi:hypothetical protein
MLHHIALQKLTDISQVFIASIISLMMEGGSKHVWNII